MHSKNHIKAILRTLSICVVFILISIPVLLQKEIEEQIEKQIEGYYNETVAKEMDISYIDYQVKAWSLRAFSVFKDHSLQLINSGEKLTYTPNNRFGVGFGFTYYPLLEKPVPLTTPDRYNLTRAADFG